MNLRFVSVQKVVADILPKFAHIKFVFMVYVENFTLTLTIDPPSNVQHNSEK